MIIFIRFGRHTLSQGGVCILFETVKLAMGVHLIKLTVFDGKDGLTSSAPISVKVQPRALSITSSSPNVLTRSTTATP